MKDSISKNYFGQEPQFNNNNQSKLEVGNQNIKCNKFEVTGSTPLSTKTPNNDYNKNNILFLTKESDGKFKGQGKSSNSEMIFGEHQCFNSNITNNTTSSKNSIKNNQCIFQLQSTSDLKLSNNNNLYKESQISSYLNNSILKEHNNNFNSNSMKIDDLNSNNTRFYKKKHISNLQEEVSSFDVNYYSDYPIIYLLKIIEFSVKHFCILTFEALNSIRGSEPKILLNEYYKRYKAFVDATTYLNTYLENFNVAINIISEYLFPGRSTFPKFSVFRLFVRVLI